jgi:hypothetical protein
MFLTLIYFELLVNFLSLAGHHRVDRQLPPVFPDLNQTLSRALTKLSMSLPTLPLHWMPLPAPSSRGASLPTPLLNVGLRRQTFAIWPSLPKLKQLMTALTLPTGTFSEIIHLSYYTCYTVSGAHYLQMVIFLSLKE